MTDTIQCLQGVMLGSLATSLAILAIAAIGFFTLSGRVAARRIPSDGHEHRTGGALHVIPPHVSAAAILRVGLPFRRSR